MSIVLPTKKVKAERVNPKRLIVYSKPKTGKTTAFAGLDDNLIIDLENGADYVEAMKVKANNLQELKEVGKAIKEAGYPYQYITIDTVTALEDMVMPLAINLYKQTPMGKNYSGDSILTLPNGAGYLYVRQAFFQVLDFIVAVVTKLAASSLVLNISSVSAPAITSAASGDLLTSEITVSILTSWS